MVMDLADSDAVRRCLDALVTCRREERCFLCGQSRRKGGLRFVTIDVVLTGLAHLAELPLPAENGSDARALLTADAAAAVEAIEVLSRERLQTASDALRDSQPRDWLNEAASLFLQRSKGVRGGVPLCWNDCKLADLMITTTAIATATITAAQGEPRAQQVISDSPFDVGYMQYDPERYEEHLQSKVASVMDKFKAAAEATGLAELAAVSDREVRVFRSPVKHFRHKCRLAVTHPTAETIRFLLWEENGFPSCPVEEFPIASELICRALPFLKAQLERSHCLRQGLRAVLFLSTLSNQLIVRLMYDHREFTAEDTEQWRLEAQQARQQIIQDFKALSDETHAALRGCLGTHNFHLLARGRRIRIVSDCDTVEECFTLHDGQIVRYIQSSEGFSNPNPYVNLHCLNWLCGHIRGLPRLETDDILELYCGNGNHTMAIAGFAHRLAAIEINKELCKAANINIALNAISNVKIIPGDSQDFARMIFRRKTYFDKETGVTYQFKTVLVDPPRCGLDNWTRSLIKSYDNILYISCSPDSLVRDLKEICTTHRIVDIAIFDQFAYTPHIETGVFLQRLP